MKIVLKDKTTFDVLETSTSYVLEVEYSSVVEIEELRSALTNSNLSKFSFTDEKGFLIGEFTDSIFTGSVSYTVTDSGAFHATFVLRSKSSEEKQAEEIEAVKAAILELSDVVFAE